MSQTPYVYRELTTQEQHTIESQCVRRHLPKRAWSYPIFLMLSFLCCHSLERPEFRAGLFNLKLQPQHKRETLKGNWQEVLLQATFKFGIFLEPPKKTKKSNRTLRKLRKTCPSLLAWDPGAQPLEVWNVLGSHGGSSKLVPEKLKISSRFESIGQIEPKPLVCHQNGLPTTV